MIRLADRTAERNGCSALVTGESLGQDNDTWPSMFYRYKAEYEYQKVYDRNIPKDYKKYNGATDIKIQTDSKFNSPIRAM